MDNLESALSRLQDRPRDERDGHWSKDEVEIKDALNTAREMLGQAMSKGNIP